MAKYSTPAQLFEVLSKTDDLATAQLVSQLLIARHVCRDTYRQDEKYYTDQVEEPSSSGGQVENEQANYDQSFVF